MVRTDSKNIDVVILCGGLGKRLRKITGGSPKPMIRIGDYPFLDLIIGYAANFGFRRFILCTGYKGEIIKDYYRDNKRQGRGILFSHEKEPLDTGGAVKKSKQLIKSNPFIVLNGDSFSKFDALDLLKFHKEKKAVISMLLTKSSNNKEYGEVRVDKSLRIRSFEEKSGKTKRSLINAGVYIFNKKIFSYMPRARKFSLERDFFPKMIGNKFYGYILKDIFLDIGIPSRYKKAKKIFSKIRK